MRQPILDPLPPTAAHARKARGPATAAGCAAVIAIVLMLAPASAGAAGLGFAGPQYVDPGLAGGEPLVLADPVHHDLLYTSHEGTTHLYRPGLVTTQPSFETNYRDQVNMWTSKDNGATWQFVSYNGTGFSTDPSKNAGFSDPDLTQDLGGRIYNTGIDLANDAIFSSADGGFTWDRGTVQCHEGDRPWLAGGKADEVFMSTDSAESQAQGSATGHTVYESTDGGNSCAQTPITAFGKLPNGDDWSGVGKLYYDRARDKLIEPMIVQSSGTTKGLGVDTWTRGDSAFKPGALIPTTIFAHWPALSIDAAGNVYLVWDTNPVDKAGTAGCSGGPSPLPNQIMMAVSHDLGKTWSSPLTIASPPNARVLWPWVVAGDRGRVSVVWYQFDKVVDADCSTSNHTFIYDANISGADDPATAQVSTVNAAGRSIHEGGVCQAGTTCVATGQDRRLGDFFTNSLDARGCVMIASGDTERTDPLTGGPLPTSLPIILRQNSGPSLLGAGDCGRGGPPAPAALGGQRPSRGPAPCRDRVPPQSSFAPRGIHVARRHLSFYGVSHDVGCGRGRARIAGAVARVRVSVAREVAHRLCSFLEASGAFSAPRSCLRTSYLDARGTEHWHFDFAGQFPPGYYKFWVRGLDRAHNIERKFSRRNFRRVRIA